jgi:hypothetical protein
VKTSSWTNKVDIYTTGLFESMPNPIISGSGSNINDKAKSGLEKSIWIYNAVNNHLLFGPKYIHVSRVAEPKLFNSAPAPAQTFKKFPLRLPLQSRLRLRHELCGCLFSQLLNEKVDFS